MIDEVILDRDNLPHKEPSEFEVGLFANGALVTDFDTELKRGEARLTQALDWIRRNPHLDDVTRELHARRARDVDRHRVQWFTAWSEQIPKHWRDWSKIRDDIAQADTLRVQLSEPLIDAAISHMSFWVALEAATKQVLDVDQLTKVLSRPDISEGRRADIIMEQHDRGMYDEDIRAAATRAEEIRARTGESEEPGHGHTPLIFIDRAAKILEERAKNGI